MPKKFAEEEKAQILARVAEIGAAAAAREAGVSYNSVLKWMKGSANAIKKGGRRKKIYRTSKRL